MSNLDDFDAPPIDEPAYNNEPRQSARSRLSEALKTNPAFKIFLVLIAVGALASAAMGVFSSGEKRDNTSLVRGGSSITSTPGGEASPAFQQAVQEASRQRAESAARQGSSALPTPLGGQTQITTLDPATGTQSDDPLAEFRATQIEEIAPREPDRTPITPAFDPRPNNNVAQPMPAQLPPDTGLMQAMSGKMSQLMESWGPTSIRVMQVTAADVPTANPAPGQPDPSITPPAQQKKILVSAGTINYGQMLIEANSDIPGTVMAKIMSGPMTGGRAIGRFEATDEHLIIRFNLVSVNGKDYSTDIMALDPDTTLSGIATEVDPRYWQRIILPAAADFVSGFADAFAQADQNVTVQDGVVITSRAGASFRQALGEGTARTGDRLADILDDQAGNIRPLVRVAAGTPIGMFFTRSVYEEEENNVQNPYGPYNPYNPYGGAQAGFPGIGGFNGLPGSGLTGTTIPGYGTFGAANNPYGQNINAGGTYGTNQGNTNLQQVAPGVSYYR